MSLTCNGLFTKFRDESKNPIRWPFHRGHTPLSVIIQLNMINHPEKHVRISEKKRILALQKMSSAQRIRIGEGIIEALISQGTPRIRKDRPWALAFFIGTRKSPKYDAWKKLQSSKLAANRPLIKP